MCTYVFTCMCVCACVFLCVYECMTAGCLSVRARVCARMSVCVCVRVTEKGISVCMCVSTCVSVEMLVSASACACLYVYLLIQSEALRVLQGGKKNIDDIRRRKMPSSCVPDAKQCSILCTLVNQ